jgi:protein-S-isoprenylcysteine O-methyltransferase Ste14
VAGLALGLYVAFLATAFGWRTWFQYRRTKDHGLRVLSIRVGSIEWFAVMLLMLGGTLNVAAPLAELNDFGVLTVPYAGSLFEPIGLALMLLGFATTILSQLEMGDSWRIGVDPHETTSLVTAGLFSHVRNPIFSGMLLAAVGLMLMVPNVLSAVGLASSFIGIEIQVRRVEEPYLIRVHGSRYLSYARRVGRFIPRIGVF